MLKIRLTSSAQTHPAVESCIATLKFLVGRAYCHPREQPQRHESSSPHHFPQSPLNLALTIKVSFFKLKEQTHRLQAQPSASSSSKDSTPAPLRSAHSQVLAKHSEKRTRVPLCRSTYPVTPGPFQKIHRLLLQDREGERG